MFPIIIATRSREYEVWCIKLCSDINCIEIRSKPNMKKNRGSESNICKIIATTFRYSEIASEKYSFRMNLLCPDAKSCGSSFEHHRNQQIVTIDAPCSRREERIKWISPKLVESYWEVSCNIINLSNELVITTPPRVHLLEFYIIKYVDTRLD